MTPLAPDCYPKLGEKAGNIQKDKGHCPTDDLIASLFKVSKDPINEIMGRVVFSDITAGIDEKTSDEKKHLLKGVIEKLKSFPKKFFATSCGITYVGLMTAIFGGHFDKRIFSIPFQTRGPDSVMEIVDFSENAFFSNPRLVMAYGVELHPKAIQQAEGRVEYPGHAFIILQYVRGNHIVFRLLESFVAEYTLKECLEMKNELSLEGFQVFLERLHRFSLKRIWDTESSDFNKTYFHSLTSFIGCDFGRGIQVEVVFGSTTLEKIAEVNEGYYLFQKEIAQLMQPIFAALKA